MGRLGISAMRLNTICRDEANMKYKVGDKLTRIGYDGYVFTITKVHGDLMSVHVRIPNGDEFLSFDFLGGGGWKVLREIKNLPPEVT